MAYRVLVVDDEPAILGLAQATLATDERYEVLTATNGVQALSVCRERRPDLVYLDVVIPRINGIEVCRELRDRPDFKDMKIVMLTALTQESDRMRAFQAGADDYIAKPFSPRTILDKTQELMNASAAHAGPTGNRGMR